jgi:isoquinoline 1-oxidoreductase beta subunit
MIHNDEPGLSRREFLSTAATATGALVVGFWMPQRAAAQNISPAGANPAGATWASESADDEINAWVVVAPDDTVTVRIAQTELGQGVWTSNAMMVCEELQCDWSKVRPQYASANRDGREMAPEWTLNVMGKGATDPLGGGEPEFGGRDRTGTTGIPNSLYRRMRTNAAASVRDGRYYLQLAGAEARERLLLAAAKTWGVAVEEVSSANSIITHLPTGRTITYGQVAPLAAQTPHPDPARIRIKPPSEWTLMGTEQKNLDVPSKVTGKAVYGIDVKLPGMKWAAVKSCPVYGGTVKSCDFERIRNQPGVISAIQFPIPDPALIRDRVFSGGVAVIADTWYQAKTALDMMPIEWDVPPKHAALDTANMRAALLAAVDKPGKIRVNLGDCDKGFSGGAKIVEATYTTPYLPRARMEPGNATVLVTDDRVDIWIGDQSPPGDALLGLPDYRHCGTQRLSPHVPPRRRLRSQRQRPASRTGDLPRQPEPRHSHPPAVDARGRLHQHHLPVHGRRALARRRGCRWLADRSRSQDGHGRESPRCQRLLRQSLVLLRAQLPLLEPHRGLPHSRGHAARRRRPGPRFLSRELYG